jgi:hypothetical protein
LTWLGTVLMISALCSPQGLTHAAFLVVANLPSSLLRQCE